MNLHERCREAKETGASENEILTIMHANGATMIEAMKIAVELFDMSLGDAKHLVAGHPSWANVGAAAEPLHEELDRWSRKSPNDI